MADEAFDFAIFGSTPMACLIAGLLKSVHGRRVCLVGEPWSPFRLPRRYDLAVAPVTRPETWALLTTTSAETLKLLATLGKGLSERIDPLFVADTAASAAALAHVRHMAAGYGYAVERVADRAITGTGAACRLRDAVMLAGGKAEPAIEAWLDRLEVRRLPAETTSMTLRRDGTARLAVGTTFVEAAQAVLADDVAILRHLDPDERDRVLRLHRSTAILTGPAKALPAPLMQFIDRDVVLLQRGKAGVLAVAGGTAADAEARIGACLGPLAPLKRAGQTSFKTLVTVDGAPLIGPAKGPRVIMMAGFGATGAFLAPALARHLAGAATETERTYFAAREPARGKGRQLVADYTTDALETQS
jgi:hypothetical protein